MKKYEGILICSDYDGTFYSGEIPAKNIEAVNRFMDEGGHFTFCTGRKGQVFKKICTDFMPNVPLIGMGGGQLYDLQNDTVLKAVFFDDKFPGLIQDFMREYHGVRTIRVDYADRTEYFMPDGSVIEKDYWTGEVTKVLERSSIYELTFEELPPVYKAVVYFDHRNAEVVSKHMEMICEGRCNPIANAWGYIELMPFGFNKGTAALELKKMTGDKTLIGVGDFLGDVSLLQAADIGYAVENALPQVKKVADRFTVNVKEGALAAIIDSL